MSLAVESFSYTQADGGDCSFTQWSKMHQSSKAYLHLMRPHPIIHRDISSGNVLLDPLPDNRWKANVSDYGSVNLLQHLTTAHPGNPFYAVPETESPTKMDIYCNSFGVILEEMLTQCMHNTVYISDDHYQISAFPFPLSASVFRFRFPFLPFPLAP